RRPDPPSGRRDASSRRRCHGCAIQRRCRPFCRANLHYRSQFDNAESQILMSELDEETAKAGRRRGTIQSVDRAARILKALASGPRRLGVSQLADQLGLPRPTAPRLPQTLQAPGFVEQDRDSDKYQLGPGLLHLGSSYLDLNELRARSLVHAERLPAPTRGAGGGGGLRGA